MARNGRTRRPGDHLGFFTVAYYGTRNRFILSETIRAYSVEDANERAERAMPPGAISYQLEIDTPNSTSICGTPPNVWHHILYQNENIY